MASEGYAERRPRGRRNHVFSEYLDKEIFCIWLCARGYVDDLAAQDRLRFPRFLPKQSLENGEMLAFAHISTGTHRQPSFYIRLGKKERKRVSW
jgi:hypothetical protein